MLLASSREYEVASFGQRKPKLNAVRIRASFGLGKPQQRQSSQKTSLIRTAQVPTSLIQSESKPHSDKASLNKLDPVRK
ncbi:hypothetical protein EIZ39_12565 [Ammoniphilus sp. CFH 90114]|nr:hypothetical protein EIZ39_12565 [Ammoniphilus sp. CFH 90114]